MTVAVCLEIELKRSGKAGITDDGGNEREKRSARPLISDHLPRLNDLNHDRNGNWSD
jgi:hypothetical protein